LSCDTVVANELYNTYVSQRTIGKGNPHSVQRKKVKHRNVSK